MLSNKLLIVCGKEEDDDDLISEETPALGFWSAFVWLVGMTCVIAVLSEYVVGTIEVTKFFSS